MPNFWQLHPFSKFNNFLWVRWFLGQNISNFVPPAWKLDNPYCHKWRSSSQPRGHNLWNWRRRWLLRRRRPYSWTNRNVTWSKQKLFGPSCYCWRGLAGDFHGHFRPSHRLWGFLWAFGRLHVPDLWPTQWLPVPGHWPHLSNQCVANGTFYLLHRKVFWRGIHLPRLTK